MRRWLLSQETELLRFRYLSSSKSEKEDFFLYYKDDFNMESVEIPHPGHSSWGGSDDKVVNRVSSL